MRASASFPASALVACMAVASPAPAAEVEVQSRIPEQALQDEPFEVRLRVTLQGGNASPESPRLPTAPGLRISEPSVSPETRVSIINGRMLQSSGVTVSWRVLASKPGKYRIGPPSIEIAGQRVQGEAKTVEVLPPDARRRPSGIPGRPPLDPFDMFDVFKGFPSLPGFPSFPFDEPLEEQAPTYPPDFTVRQAPDPTAFVVTRATPMRVVVGQPIRFGVYAYGGRGAFQIQSSNEPSRAGFVAYQDTPEPSAYAVPIQGKTFIASRVAAMVLVPVQSGTLRIGPARLGFAGRNYPPPPQDTLLFRESEPIDIVVSEPPVRGRPAGYRIGDVGRFELRASVEPKKIRQGESVSVVATLEGLGAPPAKLDLPLQSGVEWQDPTQTEKTEASDGVLRGKRTFTYVVRVDNAGQVDLGELTLPFYDPDRKAYGVARAALGTIEVSPNAAATQARPAGTNEDRLQGVLQPRRALGDADAPTTLMTDSRWYWLALALGPLGVLTASGVARASKRIGARLRERRNTPAESSLKEIANARAAAGAGDHARVATSVERAVHLALEAATSMKSRGILRSELASALTTRGFPADLALEAVNLLEATESARFVGESAAADHELSNRAETWVRAALRGRRV